MTKNPPRSEKISSDVSEETLAGLKEIREIHGDSLGNVIELAVSNYDKLLALQEEAKQAIVDKADQESL